MDRSQMSKLIEQHFEAERVGDTAGAVSVYTDDIEHDVVGSPLGVLTGVSAAGHFYDHLYANVKVEDWVLDREYYGDAHAVSEHTLTATVVGEFMGIPGRGRRITFRMLHVWEFAGEAISRENVWLDSGAIMRQLTAP